jgi:photosystem II stability/assembly factor-like uncharacterized protein
MLGYAFPMRAPLFLAALAIVAPLAVQAQWDIQNSGTTADLRGIAAVGDGTIAWASGTNGTVLRTEDAGHLWQHCTVPTGAEKLDFRGIQAFDANTAIVMSSGPGDLSRLYKTTDGCETWKLVFTNPDKDGFWDSIAAHVVGSLDQPTSCKSSTKTISGSIFGDPAIHRSNAYDKVNIPSFYLATFKINSSCSSDVLNGSASAIFSGPGEAAFAASNSVLYQPGPTVFWLATGRELIQYETGYSSPHHYEVLSLCPINFPLRHSTDSQGVFSFAVRADSIENPNAKRISSGAVCRKANIVAVGGDYLTPDDGTSTAVFTAGGKKFQLAKTMPHGYRSSVAYDARSKTWITVGPNGTDISTDDGRNWQALHPAAGEAADADRSWNALSLPFVVGPKGRIGMLNRSDVKPKP